MSWLDKLKKVFEEQKKESENQLKPETISFSQLYQKTLEKSAENSKKNDKIRKTIQEKINQFEIETKKSIEKLENVDVSEKKEFERLKAISGGNLNLYIFNLKRLISKLNLINSEKNHEYINQIFKELHEFNKSSNIAFEKATILVGKELEETKSVINNFIKEINKISSENKTLFEETEQINKINFLFKELKQADDYNKEIENNILTLNDDILKSKKEKEKTQKSMLELKNSESYKKDVQEKEAHNKKISEFESEIQNVKNKINLRELAKYHHYDKKKSDLIKEYSDNFKHALKNDENLELFSLIKDATKIELNELFLIKQNLFSPESQITTKSDTELNSLEEEIKKMEHNIIRFQDDISKESKRKEKSLSKKDETINGIKSLSKSLFSNLEII